MSFLIQRTSGRNLTLTQIHGEVLRIGRGTNQELRSENPAFALEHALIESDVAGYLITDKGSITGTYVNKKPVASCGARTIGSDAAPDCRAEMQRILQAEFERHPDDRVMFVRADAGLQYGELLQVMDIGRDAGAVVLAAVTESPPGAETPEEE